MTKAMEVILQACCGIDIHRDTAVCCLLKVAGKEVRKEIRTFSTMTVGLKELRDWIVNAGCTHVADAEIQKKLEPHKDDYQRLQTIPGVKTIGAASIIAEIGTNMSVFPSSQHLASWAGICPGNNESAGKKKEEDPVLETSG